MFFDRCQVVLYCVFFALLLSASNSLFAKGSDSEQAYVGSDACVTCHSAQTSLWRQSDHFQSMLPAAASSVLGDFDTQATFGQQHFKFLQRDGDYFVEVSAELSVELKESGDAEGGALPIRYTFGHRPLQQYLVEMSGGRLQALNAAWDSRPEAVGGQRWFHLRGSVKADSPFHYSRQLQNWNSQCAACHSTRLNKGYDTQTATYETTFSESNVACEACHGAGGDHVQAARSGGKPVGMASVEGASWRFSEGAAIASKQRETDLTYLDTCGGCHARRAQIAPQQSSAAFSDQYSLSLLQPSLYFPDGQIRDEVFVLGSFMQSKMYQRGVTCMDCHEPHTGGLKREGNQLCAGCHNPEVFEAQDHLRHVKSSAGAQCVNCHMPSTVYMQVDARRDHHFGVPNPALTIELGVPNACNQCHTDESAVWALEHIGRKPEPNLFARLQISMARQDPLAVSDAASYIADDKYPAIRRASLLSQMPVTDEAVRLGASVLQSNQGLGLDGTLMRSAAVSLLGRAPLALRQWLLINALEDPALSVQLSAISAMAPLLNEGGPAREKLLEHLPKYRASLAFNADLPSGLVEASTLEFSLGDQEAAMEKLKLALEIEPDFVPASLNLADLYRQQGDESSAMALLEKASVRAPDSGAMQHALGLALIRQSKIDRAMIHLGLATEQLDQQPRFHYVFAVALDSVSKTDRAVSALKEASRLWPNQYDLLVLEVIYREKTGLLADVRTPLRALARLAPNEPAVTRWLKKYQIVGGVKKGD
ncbi:MAG: putative CXXCH cytochrome family protein [Candidatus Azotimanducaceae bacterium]